MSLNAVIAANRFGLGASVDELTLATRDAKKWLKSQLSPIYFHDNLPHSKDILKKLRQEREQKKSDKKQGIRTKPDKYLRLVHQQMATKVVVEQISATNSLSWRLFDFFSNHFSVTANSRKMAALSPTLEREVIGPLMLGQFEHLLMAVVKHPAMLIYLNNERSIGPNSIYGRKKNKGLNENLAREILELHTLGVNGGYSQNDVTEFAKAITGWGVSFGKKDRPYGFHFVSRNHEPGTRTVLGKRYPQSGLKQGESIIKHLANHPTTARYVCYKLAHHFISDTPEEKLVNQMVNTWLTTNGNIKAVMTTLIDSPLAWQPELQKLKTPREFVVSSLRALASGSEAKKLNEKWLWKSLKELGQQPFQAGSPAGFSDDKQDWSGASALLAKVDWVAMLVKKSRAKADQVMANALANTVSQRTYQHVMRAESRSQALALLLLSPEFLKR